MERLVSELPNLEVSLIDDFTEFMGRPVPYFTHKTDIIRLQKLIEFGGVYLDLDTISLKSLEPFRNEKYVTCLEDDSWRLGSAVLMSEKGSKFAKECLEFYKEFRSVGRDEYFVEVVQEKPYQLWLSSYKESNEVTIIKADYILSPKTLLDYRGNQVYFKKFFEEDNFSLEDSYVLHLWTELNYQKYIKDFDQVLRTKSTFSKLIKRFLY
jgi:mannosyltransferase OCH1-like enzyme